MNKLPRYLLFLIVTAWITCAFVLASPSDPKNAIAFGYSLERLLLAAALILLTCPLLFLTLKLVKQPQHSQRLELSLLNNDKLYFLTILFSFVVLLLFLLPAYRLGVIASYISRLYPILIWLGVISVFAMWLFLRARNPKSLWSIIFEYKTSLHVGVICFSVFIVILLLIALTGIGIRQPEDYWFGAGVPALALQALFALCAGVFFIWVESKYVIKNIDLLLCLSVFLITAFLWAREPLLPNYFMPNTGKNPMYPYSDSATFDIGSQFALIGQGLFNNAYFDRILYSAFLTYLHMWFGQNVETILTIQSILFSVFPVILYLIGKELHSRAFGVALAALISLRGVNAIAAAAWIDLAGPKMMTTDFPTAIGIALFLLLAIKWVKNPSKLYFSILAGGALGLSMMLRTHVIFLAVAFIFFIFFNWFKLKSKFYWAGLLAFIIGMLSATTPWDIRNLNKNGTPLFYLYYSRIQIILQERYNLQNNSEVKELSPETAAEITPRQRILSRDESGCEGQVCKILNHFFHNLVASFLIFPSTFILDGLWNTVKEGAPYWQVGWRGEGINFIQWLFIFINLIFISLGIGIAWFKRKALGLLPMILFLAYMAANALAFTSAGRYIVPADWALCFYYLLGVFQAAQWLIHWSKILPIERSQIEVRQKANGISSNQYQKVSFALLCIFGAGSLIPLSETLFEKRYQVREPQIIFEELQEKKLLEQTGLSENQLSQFLLQPNALIVEGRALYPRYYRSGDGEPDRSAYYRYLDFSRLVFTVIGPYAAQAQGVVIAGDKPNFEIHTADVVVLGCWNTNYYAPFIDAIVVFVVGDQTHIYIRSPESNLICPMPEP